MAEVRALAQPPDAVLVSGDLAAAGRLDFAAREFDLVAEPADRRRARARRRRWSRTCSR
ncbi:MAG: hypothetical protein R2736_10275 [Solirubrobacterales bacterium]